MKIKRSSSTALLVLSGMFIAAGNVILSPDGRVFFLILAGVIGVVILFFGPSPTRRIFALLILSAVVLQIIPAWSEHRRLQDRYRNRVAHEYQIEASEIVGSLRSAGQIGADNDPFAVFGRFLQIYPVTDAHLVIGLVPRLYHGLRAAPVEPRS